MFVPWGSYVYQCLGWVDEHGGEMASTQRLWTSRCCFGRRHRTLWGVLRGKRLHRAGQTQFINYYLNLTLFLIILFSTKQVIQHGEVDVFQAVKTVRRHRPQLVENLVILENFILINGWAKGCAKKILLKNGVCSGSFILLYFYVKLLVHFHIDDMIFFTHTTSC